MRPAPTDYLLIEEAADILSSPGRRDEWPWLQSRVVDTCGCSPGEALVTLRRLADYLDRSTVLVSEIGRPCELDLIEERYEFMVREKVAAANGNARRRVKTDFTYDLALYHLRTPSPCGCGLDLADAYAEMLDDTPLARRSLAIARKKVARLGRECDWDPAKMLDSTWSRYEKPGRMVPGQDELRSLDDLADYKEETARRGMWAGDKDRLPPARIRSPAALRREENMREETRRRARERSAAFEPDGLNIALQPFITGELPIEKLGREHLAGCYDLPEGRPGNIELVYIRRALRFRPATEQFLQLAGYAAEEAGELLAEFGGLHDHFLRREAFHEAAGVPSVIAYRTRREAQDERTRLLREICCSGYGFYRGHDVMAVMESRGTTQMTRLKERLVES